jgi:hypothetical protein
MSDPMIAMTNNATGKARGLKSRLVGAFLVHLILESMAFGTDVLHRVQAWGRRAMISMTGSAGGRAQVAANGKGIVVHARAVLRELVGGNGMALHVGTVGMAAGTGCGDIQRVDF